MKETKENKKEQVVAQPQQSTPDSNGKYKIVRGKARGGGAATKGLGYNVSPN
jgi:hypothetical protein